MSDPIATYSDAIFPWKRKSVLYSDRIEVTSTDYFAGDSVSTVPLSLLTERIDRNFFRTQVFSGWLSFFWVSLLIAGFAYFRPYFGLIPRPHSFFELSALGIPFVVLVIIAYTARKVEAAHFIGANGFSHFNLCRSGPDRAHFDAFVAQVLGAIRSSTAQSQEVPQSQPR